MRNAERYAAITEVRNTLTVALATLDQANAKINPTPCADFRCNVPARVEFVSYFTDGKTESDWQDDSPKICASCADSYLDSLCSQLDEDRNFGVERVSANVWAGAEWVSAEDVIPPTYPDIIVSQ